MAAVSRTVRRGSEVMVEKSSLAGGRAGGRVFHDAQTPAAAVHSRSPPNAHQSTLLSLCSALRLQLTIHSERLIARCYDDGNDCLGEEASTAMRCGRGCWFGEQGKQESEMEDSRARRPQRRKKEGKGKLAS